MSSASSSSASASAFSKDWVSPRTCCQFVGHVADGVDPPGTIIHAMLNTRIPCTMEEFKKNEKGHVTFTIVGIKQLGYSCAPWKKSTKSKGKKNAEEEPVVQPKKLFDDPQTFTLGRERVYTSCKVYSFVREGQFDKGPRVDELSSTIELGQTLHFKLHEFQFDKKTGKSDVFFPGGGDDSATTIEPFTMVQVILSSAAQQSAAEGYALKLDRITPLPFTMYSYLTPANIQLLCTTIEDAQRKAVESTSGEGASAYTLRQNLEQRSPGYLAQIKNTNAFVSDGECAGMVKLVSKDEDVIPGVYEIDMLKDDMMRYTNAGNNPMVAWFLVELAVAADALYMWVFHNDYFKTKEPKCSPFRGVPLIDTEKLLRFIPGDASVDEGQDCFVVPIPVEMGQTKHLQAIVSAEPDKIEGKSADAQELPTPDLVLCSEAYSVDRGYHVIFGTPGNPHMMPLIFRSACGSGAKRSASEARIDWSTYERA